MTKRKLHVAVQWIIFFCAVLYWIGFSQIGWEHITVEQILTVGATFLILIMVRSFLKWHIRAEEQEKDTELYQKSVARELNAMKTEKSWDGNRVLDSAINHVSAASENQKGSYKQ